ncbi:CDAN1-interacting nuclease 1 isoform X2 [Hypomesus transpacificus]|uniref:CDAN1-interacting nuclease 1 isoform X2 n=1 Tax=Hypomesus transpacificus TaxID=137520 RepID=UPI001F0733D5|nr:CDAN1-interacting nuclease 1 isoform X2 [Hypomesus transpacificus]
MKLSRAEYKEIVRCTDNLRPTRQCMKILKERFPNHSQSTLLSVFSLEYQKRIKRTIPRHHAPDAIEDYYQRYLSRASSRPSSPVLLELANEVDLSPALMARIILDRFLQDQEGGAPSKPVLTSMLREPSLIPDQALANHIYQTKTSCEPEATTRRLTSSWRCRSLSKATLSTGSRAKPRLGTTTATAPTSTSSSGATGTGRPLSTPDISLANTPQVLVISR